MIKAAVLGSPISHSLSPLLHSTAYEILGIEGEYSSFEVLSGGLKEFIVRNEGIESLSLTMPLKEEALGVADEVSDISQQITSGNTLYRKSGKWHLTSTDVDGFSYALSSNRTSARGNVLIIGSGATARAVVAACNGLSDEIHVIGRSIERHASIERAAPDSTITFHPWQLNPLINTADLVVNTTPSNAASDFASSISNPRGVLFEVLYNPWPTILLEQWRKAGGVGIDGLELLIHQAISQIEIFGGMSVDRKNMAAKLRIVALERLGQSTP